MPTTQLSAWGHSLAVRIPKGVAEEAGLREGSQVRVEVERGIIAIRPAKPRYKLADLLAGITDENRHATVDDGPSVGREEW